jgi:hypothetical protein
VLSDAKMAVFAPGFGAVCCHFENESKKDSAIPIFQTIE